MSAFVRGPSRAAAPTPRTVVARSKKGGKPVKSKIDVRKQGLERVREVCIEVIYKVDPAVFANLAGTSSTMKDPNWVDPSGKKGKGIGVYRFSNKYGVNVDGYSPIYTPDIWSETGEEYKLGTTGLLAWAGLFVIVLGVGINLIIATSAFPS